MKYEILDIFINILTSLLATVIVTPAVLCIPRFILKLSPFPEFPPTFVNVSTFNLLGFIPIILGALITDISGLISK